MPTISVIIPVYNAEQYIAECIESIQHCNKDTIEIICVNDGSTDNSLSVLESLQTKDNRIKLLSQTNKGVSEARNLGIAQAIGTYITFIDADDTIKPDYFDYIFGSEQTEDAYFSTDFFYKKILKGDVTQFNKEEIIHRVIPVYLQNEQSNSVCGKFYKRTIVAANSVKFPAGMPLGEDGYFNVSFLKHCNKLTVYNNRGYVYRENEGSATRSTKRHNYLQKFIDSKDRYADIIADIGYKKEDLEMWSNTKMIYNIMSILSVYFRKSSGVPEQERMKMVKDAITNKQVIDAIKKYWEVLIQGASRFDLFILQSIRRQSLFRLKWAYKYVHYRNGIK